MANIDDLKKILGRSKELMKKVDNGDFTKGNIDPSMISEGTTDNVSAPIQNFTQRTPKTSQERYPNLEKSGLPQVIKDAMTNNPIDIPEMPSSFELTQDLVEHVNANTPTTINMGNQIKEINEQQIRDIVRSEMESFMEEYFDKAVIKEEVQIKVGNTVFSGSLKPLPKKKRR